VSKNKADQADQANQANVSAIEKYIEAASELFNVEHRERSARWSERLAISMAELAVVARTVCDHDMEPLGLPARAELAAPLQPLLAADTCKLSPLSQLAHEVASGAVDPVARVEQCLAAIDAHRDLNAFIYVERTGALAKASELRARRAAGAALGPLAGVVVAVKDCFAVRGIPMTCGTHAIPTQLPAASASVVARLQNADAIVIGMTNMHELAYGATSDNPHFGRVGHPADATRIAGGSSGGSAVAVATGMADIALGTDSAGSVRMPAALCGIVGFKPSYEVLPHQGVLPLAWSLDHVGLFASSVRDAAFIFELMANLPVDSSLGGNAPKPDEIRLFRPQNYFFELIDPSVATAFESALGKLAAAGFTLQQGAIQGLESAPALQFTTLCAEATQVHLDRALTMPEDLGDEVRVRLEAGQFLRAVDYIKAQRLRRGLRAALSAPLESSADVLITPTVLTGACKPAAALEFNGTRLPIHPALTRCTLPFNLTGMPAISIPCGVDAHGFPVGLQIAGRFGQDAQTLRVAAAVEAALKR
jgi:Asp-tRNA(Asn)/Glu-tRNA(Gln) amidotransferase A subunit family amidase